MKKYVLILFLLVGMTVSSLSPLMAECPSGQSSIGGYCCVPVGNGGAVSCTNDNTCWYCIGDCAPGDEVFCIEED